MSASGGSRPTFSLKIGKSGPKSGFKRKFVSIEQKSSDNGSSHSESTDKSTPLPETKTEIHTGPKNLDSFLDSISDAKSETNSQGVDAIGEFEDLGEENEASAPKLKKAAVTTSTNKLDKIKSDYSKHPFQKVIYEEPSELNFEESISYRESHGIHVDLSHTKGASDIMPLTAWHAACLPLPIMRVIETRKFPEPTPIQAQALPLIMKGHDMLGVAPTGSGKTVAFLIPMCKHVAANLKNYQEMHSRGPFGIVLVPTRELCVQIHSELEPWAASLNLKTLSCYGGSDISSQISALVNNECHIVVATPGRLIDLLAANNGRVTSLRAVTFLVIDETDRMFDLGFGPQVRKISESIRPDRQTIIFSATMPEPLEAIVQRKLRRPVKVVVRSGSENRLEVPPQVSQAAFLLEDDYAKFEKLKSLLRSEEGARYGSAKIVFVHTQNTADSLAFRLCEDGCQAQPLHGGMNQNDRDKTIADFRNGTLKVLVATSIAARGLDVPNLGLVVNYDPASHAEDYVHRAGRTGRAAQSGDCITLLLINQEAEAFYLAQFFNPGPKIAEMAHKYAQSHSNDKNFKWRGFGGHGLAKLDSKREQQKAIEREAFNDGETSGAIDSAPEAEADVVRNIGGKFTAQLFINDIPKDARIAVTAVGKQNEILDRYHVSLTLRGTFYASPRPDLSEDRKLHILIEGDSWNSVHSAYHELNAVVGQKSASVKPTGRYSSF